MSAPEIPVAEQIAALRTFIRLHERVGEVFQDGLIASQLDALRAALATLEAQGWQLIETAPKGDPDEDDIWIWTCRAGAKLPMLTTWDHERQQWYTFNLALERSIGWVWEPTHWMPLPAPPQEKPSSG